jgi:tetratricopeptide (TPR) repeat protein
LALFPENRQLLDSYAEFLSGQGDYQTALEQLRVVAELEHSATAYAQLARLAQQAGDTGQADSAFQQALVYAPEDSGLRSEYALLLAALHRERELLDLLKETRQLLGPAAADQMLDELGGYWLDYGEYERGADFLARVIEYDPRLSATYNALAMLEHMQGQGEQALTTVKRGLHDAGDNYFGRYLEAYLTYLTYGAEAATPLARTLLDHPQADSAAYELYLDILSEAGDYASQIEVARRGLAGFPDSVELLGYLVTALYSSGDYAGVIATLSDRHFSRLPWAPRYELLGLSYLEQGNYVKAVANLTVATEDSTTAPLWTALGEAQYLMGRGADARRSLTRALALDAGEMSAHVWLGLALLAEDDPVGAALSFDTALAADYLPEEAEAWLTLGRAQLALINGDRNGAQELLVQARMYLPLSAEYKARLDELTDEAGP